MSITRREPRSLMTRHSPPRDLMTSHSSSQSRDVSRPHRGIPLERMGSLDLAPRTLPRASLSSSGRSSPSPSSLLPPSGRSSPSDSLRLTKQQPGVRLVNHRDHLAKDNWLLQSSPSHTTLTTLNTTRPRITTGSDGSLIYTAGTGSVSTGSGSALGGYRVYRGSRAGDICAVIRDSAEILKAYHDANRDAGRLHSSTPNLSKYQRDDRATSRYGGLPKGPRSPRPQSQLLYTRGSHGSLTGSLTAGAVPDRAVPETRSYGRAGHRPWWKNPRLKDDWSKPRVVTCSASLTGKPRMTSSYTSQLITDRAGSEPPVARATPTPPLQRREASSPSLYRLEVEITPHTEDSPPPPPRSILKNSPHPRPPPSLRQRRSRSAGGGASGGGGARRYDLMTSRDSTTPPRRKSVTFNQQVEMSVGGHVFNMAALQPQLDV